MISKCFSRALISAAIAVSVSLLVLPAHATTFTFDADNQAWRNAGLYHNGDLTPIAGFFGDDPAFWFNDGGNGVLLLGSGGFPFPDSPSGFLHWDLNSPSLSGDAQWQGISSFSYDVKGEQIAVIGDSWVQAVVHVRKPDLTESYYTDGIFNQLFGSLSPTPTPWTTFSVDVASLGIPAGSTILDLNIRFVFESGSPNGHDGFFFFDNVTPRADGGPIPEPASLLLLATGLAGFTVAAWRKRRRT